MSYAREQFRDLVERTLMAFDPPLARPVAIALLLGTAATESLFGHFLRQDGGPAIGAFQMEPATFRWLRQKYSMKYPELADREAYELEWDLRLAIIMCRLRYRAMSAPLPSSPEPELLAAYWKQFYNTPSGKGTAEQFREKYEQFVSG